jgi:hypothetical protein
MAFFDTGVTEVWEAPSVIPADRAVHSTRITRVEPDSITSSYTGIFQPYEIVQGRILRDAKLFVDHSCIDDHTQPYHVLKPTVTHNCTNLTHFSNSGWWCWSLAFRAFQNRDGTNSLCNARNIDRILPRCRGQLLLTASGWGNRLVPWDDRGSSPRA